MSTPLSLLRDLVRERGGFLAGDPAFPAAAIDRQINIAMAGILSANPNGWWWNHVEVDYQNVSGADQEYVGAEAAGQFDYEVKAQRVYSVFASLDGDYWLPVEYRTTSDATMRAGGRVTSDGLPLSYSVLQGQGIDFATINYNGVVMRFSPPLPNLAHVRFITVIGAPDLGIDTDSLQGWPDIWIDAVVEQAAATLMRQRKTVGSLVRRSRLSRMSSHKQTADEWLKLLLRYANRPYEGPAAGMMHRGDR